MLLSILNILAQIIAGIYSPEKVCAEIIFAGDAMQHQKQIDVARQSDGAYDYTPTFSAMDSIIRSADYAIVNFEAPLGGKPYKGYPQFSAPDEYAIALKDAGFDLFLTANNHILDRRDKGLLRTISVLDSLDIPHVGIYKNSKSREMQTPMIVDVKGIKMAVLNYTYGTNGFEVQGDAVVDYIDRKQMKIDIEAARNAGAEIVCVAVHWGVEYKLLPHSTQKELAKYLSSLGVDIILGGHPHVIQPMELAINPVTGRNTALVYSLGNYISNMSIRDGRGGAIAKVTLRRDSAGTAYVDDLSYKLVFTLTPNDDCDNFRVVPADSHIPGVLGTKRNEFVKAAENIFNNHNINVGKF